MPVNKLASEIISPEKLEKKLSTYMKKCEETSIPPTLRGLMNYIEIWVPDDAHLGDKYTPNRKHYKKIINKYKAKIHEYYAVIVAKQNPTLYWSKAFAHEYKADNDNKEIEIRQDENNKPIITIVNKNTRKLD